MPARKIQDEAEAVKLFEKGLTYDEIIQFYRDKYNIETTLGMWSSFRGRKGLKRRITRDTSLIPWKVKLEHRHDRDIILLRREARRRAGNPLDPDDLHELEVWKELNDIGGSVVLHYDPDTEQGWFLVPRRPGIDNDLIREPDPGRRDGKGVVED